MALLNLSPAIFELGSSGRHGSCPAVCRLAAMLGLWHSAASSHAAGNPEPETWHVSGYDALADANICTNAHIITTGARKVGG